MIVSDEYCGALSGAPSYTPTAVLARRAGIRHMTFLFSAQKLTHFPELAHELDYIDMYRDSDLEGTV